MSITKYFVFHDDERGLYRIEASQPPGEFFTGQPFEGKRILSKKLQALESSRSSFETAIARTIAYDMHVNRRRVMPPMGVIDHGDGVHEIHMIFGDDPESFARIVQVKTEESAGAAAAAAGGAAAEEESIEEAAETAKRFNVVLATTTLVGSNMDILRAIGLAEANNDQRLVDAQIHIVYDGSRYRIVSGGVPLVQEGGDPLPMATREIASMDIGMTKNLALRMITSARVTMTRGRRQFRVRDIETGVGYRFRSLHEAIEAAEELAELRDPAMFSGQMATINARQLSTRAFSQYVTITNRTTPDFVRPRNVPSQTSDFLLVQTMAEGQRAHGGTYNASFENDFAKLKASEEELLTLERRFIKSSRIVPRQFMFHTGMSFIEDLERRASLERATTRQKTYANALSSTVLIFQKTRNHALYLCDLADEIASKWDEISDLVRKIYRETSGMDISRTSLNWLLQSKKQAFESLRRQTDKAFVYIDVYTSVVAKRILDLFKQLGYSRSPAHLYVGLRGRENDAVEGPQSDELPSDILERPEQAERRRREELAERVRLMQKVKFTTRKQTDEDAPEPETIGGGTAAAAAEGEDVVKKARSKPRCKTCGQFKEGHPKKKCVLTPTGPVCDGHTPPKVEPDD